MISFDLELRKSVTEIWSEFTSIHADWMDRQGWTQLIAHSFPAVACQSRNKGRKDNSWAEREKWIPNIPKYLSNSFWHVVCHCLATAELSSQSANAH